MEDPVSGARRVVLAWVTIAVFKVRAALGQGDLAVLVVAVRVVVAQAALVSEDRARRVAGRLGALDRPTASDRQEGSDPRRVTSDRPVLAAAASDQVGWARRGQEMGEMRSLLSLAPPLAQRVPRPLSPHSAVEVGVASVGLGLVADPAGVDRAGRPALEHAIWP